MAVILNETKQAEYILETGEVGSKPTSTLFLLGKYYRQKQHLNKNQTFSRLNEFMLKHYHNYNPVLWESLIEDISRKAGQYSLREIQSIGIARSEMEQITEVRSLKYQQLLFTMLCYAKFYNTLSTDNHGWVNTTIREIYKTARVTVKNRKDRFLYLNDLAQTGLISFSAKNDNLNIRINFADMNGETVLSIEDFREPGYEYLNYIGSEHFIRCADCKRLVKRTGNNTRYCKECRRKKELEKYKKYNQTRKQPLF